MPDDNANPSPKVLSHTATTTNVGTGAAGVADIITPGQVLGDWWIEYVGILTPRELTTKVMDAWIGSQTDDFAGMIVEWGTTILAPGQVRVTYGDSGAGFHQKTVTVADFAIPHTWAVVYKAAGQTFELWFDGVLQQSFGGSDLSGIDVFQFQIYFNDNTGTVASPTMSYVELGIGRYV